MKMTAQKKRVLIVLAVCLCGALSGLLLKNRLIDYARQFAEKEIASSIDGEVAISDVDVSMLRPTISIAKIELSSAKYGIENITLRNLDLRVSPVPFFFGRFVIKSVDVQRIDAKGKMPDLATLTKREDALEGVLNKEIKLIRIVVRKLNVANGNIFFDWPQEKSAIALSIDSLQGVNLGGKRPKVEFEGKVAVDQTATETLPEKIKLDHLLIDIQRQDHEIQLNQLLVSSALFELDGKGTIFPRFDAETHIDTYLETWLGEENPWHGLVSLTSTIEGTHTYPRFKVEVESSNIRYKNHPIDKTDVRFRLSPELASLESAQFKFGSGELNAVADWNLVTKSLTGEMGLRKLPLARLLALSGNAETLPREAQGAVSGTINMEGELDRSGFFSRLDGTQTLRLEKIDIPILSEVDSSSLQLPWLEVATNFKSADNFKVVTIDNLRIASDELSITGEASRELESGSAYLRGRVSEVWKTIHPSLQDLDGTFQTELVVNRNSNNLTAQISLASIDLKFLEPDMWGLTSQIIYDNDRVDVKQFVLQSGSKRIDLSGTLEPSRKIFNRFRVGLANFPMELPLKLIKSNDGKRYAFSEHLSGDVTLTAVAEGPFLKPQGSASIEVVDFDVYGQQFDQINISTQFEGGRINIDSLSALAQPGVVSGSGYADFNSNEVEISATGEKMTTRSSALVSDFVPKELPIDLFARIHGKLDQPLLGGQVIILEETGQKPLLVADVSDKIVHPTITFRPVGNESTFTLKTDVYLDLLGNLDRLDAFTLARKLGYDIPVSLTSSATGSFFLKQRANTPVKSEFNIGEFDFARDDVRLLRDSSFLLKSEGSGLLASECSISGPTTSLVCSNGTIKGTADLNLLSAFLPYVFTRSEGTARLNLTRVGAIDAFDAEGEIDVEKGVLSIVGFPTLLENITIQSVMTPRRIAVTSLSVDAETGSATGGGEMLLPKKEGIVFNLAADATNFPVRIPEDFPGVVTGNLTFTGPYSNMVLAGDFEINSLRYTKRFNWRSRLLSFSASARRAIGNAALVDEGNARGVTFDIKLNTPSPTISISNNVGDILATGDFAILGRYPDVGIKGVFNVENGRILFRNHTFEMESGVVRFPDEKELFPIVDIYASTRVQTYTVTINIRTVEDEVRLLLTSTPPLNETDILTLLTVGVISDTLAGAPTDQAGVTEGLALGILSGALQDSVERIGIIDTFQVVPDYSKTSKTTDLKILLGKGLTKDLGLFYSTDLYNAGTNQEVNLRQTINPNFSVLGSVKNSEIDQEVDVGVDFEFNFDF